jgi:hypothetical protein
MHLKFSKVYFNVDFCRYAKEDTTPEFLSDLLTWTISDFPFGKQGSRGPGKCRF